jgi:hypothetical protein
MRVVVDDPEQLPELVDFLAERTDVVVTDVGPNAVEVSLLGSYGGDAMRMELELLLRVWEVSRAGVHATVVD